MQKITIEAYEYDELDEKAKEKAREWYRDTDTETPFLTEDLEEALYQILTENKEIECDDTRIFYSLGYCQGDGVMFEAKGTYKETNGTIWDFEIVHSGHYYHYNSKTINLSRENEDGEIIYPDDSIYNEFNDLYVSICRKLEKKGYDYIEAENSDETVSENIRINEYLFTKDGVRKYIL